MSNETKQVTVGTIRSERVPGGDIPETVATFVMLHPEMFAARQSLDRDTEKVMRMSKKGIEKEDAEAIAWLLWRSRMVLSWSRNPVTLAPTQTWETAVESAWLKDELFAMCNERRKRYYEAQQARRDRLENLMLTSEEEGQGASQQEKAQQQANRQQAIIADEKLEAAAAAALA